MGSKLDVMTIRTIFKPNGQEAIQKIVDTPLSNTRRENGFNSLHRHGSCFFGRANRAGGAPPSAVAHLGATDDKRLIWPRLYRMLSPQSQSVWHFPDRVHPVDTGWQPLCRSCQILTLLDSSTASN